MNNINEFTGIPYGFISANSLDPELVQELMYGSEAIDLSYRNYYKETAQTVFHAYREFDQIAKIPVESGFHKIEELIDNVDDSSRELFELFLEGYECSEPEIMGTYQEVAYLTSWLGGALHFFILNSPVTTNSARAASPCVPNCGILDTLDGEEFSYDVPADWRIEE